MITKIFKVIIINLLFFNYTYYDTKLITKNIFQTKIPFSSSSIYALILELTFEFEFTLEIHFH